MSPPPHDGASAGARFANRAAAGVELARLLIALHPKPDCVLGLPRGGVVVAAELARVLGARLDVLVSMKLHVPGRPELAAGAVAPGAVLIDERAVHEYGISQRYLDVVADELAREVAARMSTLRARRPPLDVAGRHVVVVDDGVASGATLAAAVLAARAAGAARVTAAAPVASPDGRRALAIADDVVVIRVPDHFGMVSDAYIDFGEVSDAVVCRLLDARL